MPHLRSASHHSPTARLGAPLILVVALGLLPGPPAPGLRADDRLDLERYGFSRRLDRSSQAGAASTAPLSPSEIPKPRTRPLPTRNPAFAPPPPPPDRAAPLVLRDLPTPPRLPVGVAPSPPLEPDDRARYVGDARCLECHAGHREAPERSHLALSRHAASIPAERRGCEGCHGPGSRHPGDPKAIVNPARLPPEVASRACLDCHRMQALADPHEWFFSRHATSRLSCTTCHSIHQARSERDLLASEPDRLCSSCHARVEREFRMRSRHPTRPEGFPALGSTTRAKVSCLDCHDPHGGPGPHASLREASVEETCERCHPGHTGPFVFPHVPADRREGGCLACHRPHGSPHRDLLRSTGRTVCLQCHTDLVTHFPATGCASQSCHRDVHGSNQSPLFFR